MEYWDVFTRWAQRVLGADQQKWRWMMRYTDAGQRFEQALHRFGLYESYMERQRSYHQGLRGSIMGEPSRLMIRTHAST